MASPSSMPRGSRQPAIDAALGAHDRLGRAHPVAVAGAGAAGTEAFPGADKVFHGAAYFVTTLLFLFAAV
jgi:hypothetical protein